MTPPKRTLGLIYLVLFVNVFDIVIHVVADEVEPLRVIGNVLVLVGCAMLVTNLRHRLIFAASIAIYLVLNVASVIQYGIGPLGVVLIATTTLGGAVIVGLLGRTADNP